MFDWQDVCGVSIKKYQSDTASGMSNSGPTSSPHLVQASNFAFPQLFSVLVLYVLDMRFKAILKCYFDAMMCNVSLLLSSVCKCGIRKQHSADGPERTPEASSTHSCGWLWKFLACFTWMPCLGRHCKLKHVLAFVILKYFCVGIKRWSRGGFHWEIHYCAQNWGGSCRETVQNQIMYVPKLVKWFKIFPNERIIKQPGCQCWILC